MKTMLAHILLNYDVKFADGRRPDDMRIAMAKLPAKGGKVMFRKRRVDAA